MLRPSQEAFERLAMRGNLVPVVREIFADHDTPLSLYRRLDDGHRISFTHRFLRDIPRFFEAFPEQNDRFDDFTSGQDRVHQVDLALRVALGARRAATYRVAYSFEKSLLFGNEGGIEYISGCRCWAGRIELMQDRSRGVGVRVLYTLLGLGDDSRNPFGFLDSL